MMMRYRQIIPINPQTKPNQNKTKMAVLDFVFSLQFAVGVLVGWKLLPYAVGFVKRFIKL